MQIALQFLKPFKSSSTTTFELVERDGDTNVTWRMVGPKTFMTRFMGIFMSMDKIVGHDFEKGLDRLKTAALAAGSTPRADSLRRAFRSGNSLRNESARGIGSLPCTRVEPVETLLKVLAHDLVHACEGYP